MVCKRLVVVDMDLEIRGTAISLRGIVFHELNRLPVDMVLGAEDILRHDILQHMSTATTTGEEEYRQDKPVLLTEREIALLGESRGPESSDISSGEDESDPVNLQPEIGHLVLVTAAEDIPTDVEGLEPHIAELLGPADLNIEEDLEGYDVLDEALQRACDTELDMVRRLPCPRYSGQSGHGTRSASLVNGIGPTKESTNGNSDARDVGTDREGLEAFRLCTNDQLNSSTNSESMVEEDCKELEALLSVEPAVTTPACADMRGRDRP
jgi:hypothetical protein